MNYQIIISVLISIALHLGVLGFVHISPDIKIKKEQGGSSLLVSLTKTPGIEKTDSQKKKPQTSHQPDPVKKINKLIATTQPRIQKENIHKNKKAAVPALVKPVVLDNNLSEIIQTKKPDYKKVTRLLSSELSRYFYYPKIAQRRHWQGQVLLEFIIMSDGNISQIQVSKSSGYEVLDNAAINALNKIEEHEYFALALNGHNIKQILPITYKLIN